jgi:hypothetical protein
MVVEMRFFAFGKPNNYMEITLLNMACHPVAIHPECFTWQCPRMVVEMRFFVFGTSSAELLHKSRVINLFIGKNIL